MSKPRFPIWGCVALLLSFGIAACNGANLAGRGGPVQLREPDYDQYGPFGFDRYGRTNPNRTRVALLLPLTGPGSEIGPAMLNAAQMALFDASDDSFELIPRDTGGTPHGAADAASAAIAEGAQLILGPLFGSSVPEVRAVAQSAGLNVVAFTNDRTVAGGNVLIMGFVPAGQVEQIVQYSITQGLYRFAALAPDTAYGGTVVEAMQEVTETYGVTLERIQFYDPAAADVSTTVEQIAEPGLFGTVPYDAILVAESGLQLRAISAMLPYYEVTDVQLLGTGVWDGPDLGIEPAMVGGWFAAPQPELRSDFEARYQSTFNAPPLRLATLAYDAVALAVALNRMPDGPGYDMDTLTSTSGFAGMDGVFRFGEDGVVDRALAILEVQPEGPVVRVPAATSFVLAGS
ncbi:MAG: penicillin-binding protein activator [Inquilinus sp.]|nr:penicillin-binding protein activator [Inquilinus sp.]